MTILEHRLLEASKDAELARIDASRHPESAHYARRCDRRCRIADTLNELVWRERIAIAHGMKPSVWRKK